ncbi:unnamed protein product [Gadus morhua 'NCC']
MFSNCFQAKPVHMSPPMASSGELLHLASAQSPLPPPPPPPHTVGNLKLDDSNCCSLIRSELTSMSQGLVNNANAIYVESENVIRLHVWLLGFLQIEPVPSLVVLLWLKPLHIFKPSLLGI